jgi:hypothetical protein
MNEREKLQSEIVSGLDDLAKIVQQEESRQAGQPTRSVLAHHEEVLKLKRQLDELNERFIDLSTRIESGEDRDRQSSRGKILRSQTLRPPELNQIRSFAPSIEDEMVWMREAKKPRRRWLSVALLGLLAGGLGIWLRYRGVNFGTGEVAVQSEPAGADVYIGNQFRGQTPLRLKPIRAGNYRVRITKEGYEPQLQEVYLGQGETARVEVHLNELSAADLQTLAQSLFNQGKLREADRICTLLFRKPPYDAFALDLKQKILTGLLAQINAGELPRETASADPVTQPGGQSALATSKPPGTPDLSERAMRHGAAGNARVHHIDQTPSDKRPATVPVRPTIQSEPTPSTRSLGAGGIASQVSTTQGVRSQLGTIDTAVLDRIKDRIQSKNFAEARALLQHLPEASAPVVELRNLMELAESEVQEQKTRVSSSLQKAESALLVGHYITPPDDNVVLHCNRGLSLEPQNQRLLALKKDVIQRSIAQARDWIQRGKFEQARACYSSLNYLAQNDPGFPVQRQWFQEEINKLEFTSYPVIHEHKFGSCNGRLRMNAHVLSFVPSGDSSHGFTEALRNTVVREAGETLKVRLAGRNYEFHPNSNQESASNRQAFQAVYEQLMNLVAKASH